MDIHSFKIGNSDVEIIQAINITDIEADAVIVPQFQESFSTGMDGVAVALAKAGAAPGILQFQNIINGTRHKSLPFGTAHITASGGGKIPHLISVISVGETRERAFNTVHDCVVAGLNAARAHGGIKAITIPALSTGSEGSLSNRQSAQTMMLGIHDYLGEGHPPIAVTFVVQRPPIFGDFVDVAKDRSYESANLAQIGERDFDGNAFILKMKSRIAPEVAALLKAAVP